MKRILVIDDDTSVRLFLKRALAFEGYEPLLASSGEEGLEKARANAPDLILLDLMMPGIDGFEVLRRLRSGGSDSRVIMITANDAPEAELEGLNSGADDYVVKPINFDVLMARMRAIERRLPSVANVVLQHGALSMDVSARTARRGERPLVLSDREFKLLRTFLEIPERVVSNGYLLDRVWGEDFFGDENVIEVVIAQLRNRLEEGGEPRVIHTIENVGYVLRTADSPNAISDPLGPALGSAAERWPFGLDRILVIDDDASVRSFLKRGLSFEGFAVDTAASGEAGLRLALEDKSNLVLLDLDLGLAEMDGFEVLRRLRDLNSDLPLMMLTANHGPEAQLRCLDGGADAYVEKPVNFDVLMARIRAVQRRTGYKVSKVLRFDDLYMDLSGWFAFRGKRHVVLTAREFRLLHEFLKQPERVMSNVYLLDRVWGEDFLGDENVVEVFTSQLQQKLEVDGGRRLIHAIEDVGYVLRSS